MTPERMKETLIIIVPCYNDEEVLPETTRQLTALLEQMIGQEIIAVSSRILYVNDGSRDRTWELICHFHNETPYVCGVNLAGNVGHQNALMAGLETAKTMGDMILSIDSDLQDDIMVIPEMVRKCQEGNDIIYGVRKERKTDTWFKRTTAQGFYRLMSRLGVKSVYNHADFRLMSRRAVEQLCRYRERNLFLRGIVPQLGYKTDCVYYDRHERIAGESHYTLKKLVGLAIDGITSFSVKPVRALILMGGFFLLIALGILVYVLCAIFAGKAVSGWASLILSTWFIGGCLLLGLGIVGEYIGKIYLETKDRPRFNIEKTLLK